MSFIFIFLYLIYSLSPKSNPPRNPLQHHANFQITSFYQFIIHHFHSSVYIGRHICNANLFWFVRTEAVTSLPYALSMPYVIASAIVCGVFCLLICSFICIYVRNHEDFFCKCGKCNFHFFVSRILVLDFRQCV